MAFSKNIEIEENFFFFNEKGETIKDHFKRPAAFLMRIPERKGKTETTK